MVSSGSGDSKLHVLFLPSFYIEPGRPVLGIFFRQQALALKKYGCQVRVAYVESRKLRAFRIKYMKENHGQISISDENGLTTMRLHGWNPLLQTFAGGVIWAVATRILVNRYIKHFGRPDIIHAHNAYWAGYSGYLIWRKTNIPYVITEHSSKFLLKEESGQPRWVCRAAYQNASKVLAVSNAMKKSIEHYVDKSKCDVVPNCVDAEYSTLPPARLVGDNFTFLAIAHLSRNKGFDILLKAFAQKFKGDVRTFMKIGGDGVIRNELESLCCELQIRDKVQFLGALSKQEVRAAMWDSNAFVLSSFHETFGVVLIEAMATGLPVIATKSGGPSDIVTSEVGLLVEVGDINAMADAMQAVRFGRRFEPENIRSEAISKYGAHAFAKQVVDIYTDVVERAY